MIRRDREMEKIILALKRGQTARGRVRTWARVSVLRENYIFFWAKGGLGQAGSGLCSIPEGITGQWIS
jgi:hypothetical protein